MLPGTFLITNRTQSLRLLSFYDRIINFFLLLLLYNSFVTGILIGYSIVPRGVLVNSMLIGSPFHQAVEYNMDWPDCIHMYLNDTLNISYFKETL